METVIAMMFSVFFILVLTILSIAVEESRNYNAYRNENINHYSTNSQSEMIYQQKFL